MDRNLQDIEDMFRNELEDNEEIPPTRVWNAIDKSLDKDNAVSLQEKHSKLKKVVLLLLFLFTGLSIFELTNRHHYDGRIEIAFDHLKTEAKTGSNSNEPISTHNYSSPQSIDSLSMVHNKNEVAAIVNSLTDKSIPIPKKQQNKSSQNIVTHNLIAVKYIPGIKSKLNSKLNSEIKNKSYNAGNDIADEHITSKNKQIVAAKARHKVKINSTKATEDALQAIVEDKPAQQFPSADRLNSPAAEKTAVHMKDSADTDNKKILEVPVVTEIIQLSETKNTIAIDKKTKKGNLSHFSVTLFYSPDIAWYRLQENKASSLQNNSTEIENGEKHEFSSTAGALIDYRLSKHWSLQSGVNYSNTTIIVEPKTIYAQTDNTGNIKYRINTSSGYGFVLPSFNSNPSIGDSLYVFSSTHTLQYIGIPLAIKYGITKGKFSLNALVAVTANFLAKGKIEATVENGFNTEAEVVNNLHGLKKIYFSGLTGLGAEYNFNRKIALSFVPTYRFALNSINKDVSVKSYPNSVGLAVGLKYHF